MAEISDDAETIRRASQASGSRKMIEDLAEKMRNGGKKSAEWKLGYETAKSCFDHAFKTGRRCPGSAPYVYYVEAVAWSLSVKEKISQDRIDTLKGLLGNEFNQGVYDFLIEKVGQAWEK